MFQDSGTLSPAVWIYCVRCFRTVAQYHQRYEYIVSDVSGQWHIITSGMNTLCLMFQDSDTLSPAVWIRCVRCFRTVAQYHQRYEYAVSDVSGQWHIITSGMNTLCQMFQDSGTLSPAVWIHCVRCFRTVAHYHQRYEYTVPDGSGQWHSITSSMNTLCQMFQDSGTLSPAVWIHCVWCFRTVAHYHQRYEYTVSDVSGQWHIITSGMNTLCHMFQDSGTLSTAVWIHCVRCFRTVAYYHQRYEYTVSDVSGQWHIFTSGMNTLCQMFQDSGTLSPAVWIHCVWCFRTVTHYHQRYDTLCQMFQDSGTLSPAAWIDCVWCFRTVAHYHQQYE